MCSGFTDYLKTGSEHSFQQLCGRITKEFNDCSRKVSYSRNNCMHFNGKGSKICVGRKFEHGTFAMTNLGYSAAIWCAGSWYTSRTKRTWQEWPGRCASRSADTREAESTHGECWKGHYCRVLSGSTLCMSKLISMVNWKWSWPMWIQHMEKFFQKIIELCQTRQHLTIKYFIRLHHNCGACDYWQFLPGGNPPCVLWFFKFFDLYKDHTTWRLPRFKGGLNPRL